MKLLLVEDTKNKSEKIESFLKKTYSEIGLEIIKKSLIILQVRKSSIMVTNILLYYSI